MNKSRYFCISANMSRAKQPLQAARSSLPGDHHSQPVCLRDRHAHRRTNSTSSRTPNPVAAFLPGM